MTPTNSGPNNSGPNNSGPTSSARSGSGRSTRGRASAARARADAATAGPDAPEVSTPEPPTTPATTGVTAATPATAGAGLVVGVGVSSQARPAAIRDAIDAALQEWRQTPERAGAPLLAVTTWAAKADDPTIRALARHWGVPVWPHESATLRARDPGTARVRALTGPRSDNPPGTRGVENVRAKAARVAREGAKLAPSIGSVARASVLASEARPLHDKRIAGGCTYVLGWLDPAQVQASAPGGPEEPLRHHGDREARDCPIDLAVNVLSEATPTFLREVFERALADVSRYPDELPARRRLAAFLGVDLDRLLLVNGAAEAFMLIAHARAWRAPLVVHPQFTEPDAALEAAGHAPTHHVLTADEGFALDPDRVPTDADLVVVGNPTNPTSRLHSADALRAIRDAGPVDRVLVVDEAFMDVVAGEEQTLLHDHRRLDELDARTLTNGARAAIRRGRPVIEARAAGLAGRAAGETGVCVVRSLTKTYAIPGIRAGYVVGDPAFIARLRQLQPPWSVNALALAAIDALPSVQGVFGGIVQIAQVPRRRKRLADKLTRAGLQVVPEPAGPFVLAYHPLGEHLRICLREKGIAVRRGDTFPGLGPGWLRFAVRDDETTDHVIRELRAILRAATRTPRRRAAATKTTAAKTTDAKTTHAKTTATATQAADTPPTARAQASTDAPPAADRGEAPTDPREQP